jgi:fibronectin type III domain protein
VVTWTNTNLAAGTTYFYRVRAYEGLVNGTYSEVASATTLPPPPAPSGLTATPTSATSIRLDWVDNSASESGFKIERSLDGVSWSQVGIVTANATSWTNNSLAPDTPYWYRVRAYESSANGDYSEPASATTFPAPAAPTNLSAVATNSKTIELSWSDNSGSEKGFRIERSTDGGTTWTFVTNVGANVTTYTQKFLSSGTTYMYRVRSYDGTVVSDWSNTASATP